MLDCTGHVPILLHIINMALILLTFFWLSLFCARLILCFFTLLTLLSSCLNITTHTFLVIFETSSCILADTAMGVNMDALHHGHSDYVKAVYLVKAAIAVRQRTPWYWPDWIYDNLPVGREVNKGIDTMHSYAHKVSNTALCNVDYYVSHILVLYY